MIWEIEEKSIQRVKKVSGSEYIYLSRIPTLDCIKNKHIRTTMYKKIKLYNFHIFKIKEENKTRKEKTF